MKLLQRSLIALCSGAIALAAFPAHASALDAPLTVVKQFGVSQIAVGGTTTLTISLENTNVDTATGVAFTDTLASGLVVASPNGLSNNCGGTVTATPGSGSVSLANGTLGGSGRSCSLTVNVTGTTAGVKNNSVTVAATEFGTSVPATVSVTVIAAPVLAPPTLTKAFGVPSIPQGATTTLTFTLTNPNPATPLTRVTFADPFPLGLMVAVSPSVSNTCGGAPSVGPYALAVALGGGTIPAGEAARSGST